MTSSCTFFRYFEFFAWPFMKYFQFEKMIIQDCSSQSHLLLMAEGLNINKILCTLLSFYDHPDSLALIINFDEDLEDFLNQKYVQMRTMNAEKRKKNYEIGGVKICLAQTLLSDLLNNIVKIDTISALFIANAEKIRENSLIAFIIHIIKFNSPDSVVKAFSDDPIQISKNNIYLSSFLQNLKLNTILLYPRFRIDIDKELSTNCKFTEIKISMPHWLEDVQLYLLDLIQSIKNEIEKHKNNRLNISEFYTEKQTKDNIKIIKENVLNNIGHTLRKDLRNLNQSLEFLFTLNFDFFIEHFTEIYNFEIQNKGKTWILNTSSHVIMEIIEAKINKAGIKNYYHSEQKKRLRTDDKEEINKISTNEINNKNKNIISDNMRDEINFPKEVYKNSDICQNIEKDNNSNNELSNTEKNFKDNSHNIMNSKIISAGKKNFMSSKYVFLDKSHSNRKYSEVKKLIKEHQNQNIVIISKYYFNELILDNFIDHDRIRFIQHKNFQTTESDIIILLDFNLGTFRKIEQINKEIQVYFIFYKNSAEEEFYINRIREEKDIFTRFISEKGSMGLQDFEFLLDMEDNDSEDEENNQFKVTIDYRELRSALPYFLHRANNCISIAVLEEGDYLFENFLVERKSIYDLIGSLNNGRLLSQMTRIFSHHKNYYLLIEYDRKISLQSYTNNNDTLRNNLISKFCLLAIKFPKLKFIHSNNDILTVRILRELQKKKMNREKVHQLTIDPVLLEILLSIPGINSFCVRKIQQNYKNLKEFILANKQSLCNVLGSERGTIVFQFFR